MSFNENAINRDAGGRFAHSTTGESAMSSLPSQRAVDRQRYYHENAADSATMDEARAWTRAAQQHAAMSPAHQNVLEDSFRHASRIEQVVATPEQHKSMMTWVSQVPQHDAEQMSRYPRPDTMDEVAASLERANRPAPVRLPQPKPTKRTIAIKLPGRKNS